jgi:superfamily I DNA and/or RNA helicase
MILTKVAERPADRKFHDLLRLAEEWQLRFGSSREFYAAMIADSSVVVAGTCLGFARVPGMLAAEFDVCIVDEASKATATELLVPLSRARRWILVGDPKQLPPSLRTS